MPAKKASTTPRKPQTYKAPPRADKSDASRSGNGMSGVETVTLPRSLVAALPVSTVIMYHVGEIEKLLPQLEKELSVAAKGGAVSLARAYVTLRTMSDRMKLRLKITDSGRPFGATIERHNTEVIPQSFEQAGVPHVVLDEGYRVGVSMTFRASIIADKKAEAYDWLRNNGLPDIITQTVNASTLSAAVKKEVEEKNREFPEDLFKVATVPTVSVTQTK